MSSKIQPVISLGHCLAFLLTLHPSYVKAQFLDNSTWDAPPLATATLAITALFALVTLLQLIILLSYLCRGRASHMAPVALIIVTTMFLFISYILEIVWLVINYTFVSVLPPVELLATAVAGTFFSFCADPMMVVALVLIIRDRYVTYHKTESNILSLYIFTGVLAFLSLLVFILSWTYTGLLNAHHHVKFETLIGVRHARAAFFLVAAVTSLGFATFVKLSVKSDKILNFTLFGVVPLHILCAIAAIITSVYTDRQFNFGSAINMPDMIFAQNLVFGILYIAIIGFLCYFCLNPSYWNWPEGKQGKASLVAGVMPVAQFPGQWGYSGQPQQFFPGQPQPYLAHPPQQPYGPPNGAGQDQPFPGSQRSATPSQPQAGFEQKATPGAPL